MLPRPPQTSNGNVAAREWRCDPSERNRFAIPAGTAKPFRSQREDAPFFYTF
jgi:hypothetical protein